MDAINLTLNKPLKWRELKPGMYRFKWQPQAVEIDQMSKRMAPASMKQLSATGKLHVPEVHSNQAWRLSAHIHTDVEQQCVITLEPIQQALEVPVDLELSLPLADTAQPHADQAADEGFDGDDVHPAGSRGLMIDEELPSDGLLDLADVMVQQVILALDPFPRAAGVSLTQHPWMKAHSADQAPASALAESLKKWQEKSATAESKSSKPPLKKDEK